MTRLFEFIDHTGKKVHVPPDSIVEYNATQAGMVVGQVYPAQGYTKSDNSTTQTNIEIVPGSYAEKASKLRPSLLPVEATVEGTKAMEFGAAKYGAHQWRTANLTEEDFLNALERHLIAYKQGEKNAQDSGVSHLGHIIANCGILLARFSKGEGK